MFSFAFPPKIFRRRRYAEEAKAIPWRYLGRRTMASRLAQSLIPIGTYPDTLPKVDNVSEYRTISSEESDFERYIMNIVGTGIQASKDLVVTCLHVVQSLHDEKSVGYLLLSYRREDGRQLIVPSSYALAIKYLD